jgi:hypothetical protein
MRGPKFVNNVFFNNNNKKEKKPTPIKKKNGWNLYSPGRYRRFQLKPPTLNFADILIANCNGGSSSAGKRGGACSPPLTSLLVPRSRIYGDQPPSSETLDVNRRIILNVSYIKYKVWA